MIVNKSFYIINGINADINPINIMYLRREHYAITILICTQLLIFDFMVYKTSPDELNQFLLVYGQQKLRLAKSIVVGRIKFTILCFRVTRQLFIDNNHLTRVFATLFVPGAYHPLRDVNVLLFKPRVTQISVQYGNLDFVYGRLVISSCENQNLY